LISALTISITWGSQSYKSFIIRIYSDYSKVISPRKFTSNISTILENKSQILIRGRLQKNNGEVIRRLSLAPNKTMSVNLKLDKGESAYFIPESPPFQELELSIGNNTYEIPQKK
jgi:hypothetical protein